MLCGVVGRVCVCLFCLLDVCEMRLKSWRRRRLCDTLLIRVCVVVVLHGRLVVIVVPIDTPGIDPTT